MMCRRIALLCAFFASAPIFARADPPSVSVAYDSTTGEVVSQDATEISTTGVSTIPLPALGGDYVGQFVDAGALRPPTASENLLRLKRKLRRDILQLASIRAVANAQGFAAEVSAIDRDVRVLRAKLSALP